jgi:type IV secretion system protein TrbI
MSRDDSAAGAHQAGIGSSAEDGPIAEPLETRAWSAPGYAGAKLDPEALELRARPRPVVRFRRGVLIAGAAGLATAIAAIAWVALQPVGLRLAGEAPELTASDADRSPEALEQLPSSYGAAAAVPELGPPLPGDLGRPILAQQRASAAEEGGLSPPVRKPDRAAQAAAAERERRTAELAQARTAPVLMQISAAPGRGEARSAAPELLPAAQAGSADGSGQRSSAGEVNAARLQAPASRWQISAGSVIAASLLSGLNSDVPGLVVAQVTEPVFDSATGRAVLVPQGARLLGRYDSRIAFGQQRALLVWERLILPDGSSLTLDNAPATDAAGYAGVADRVDFHTWRLLKGIGLSTLLGVGTELTFGRGETDLVRALRESIQANADRAGQKIVERNLDVAPTITVRPGYPVRVLVHKDLVLPPWRGR